MFNLILTSDVSRVFSGSPVHTSNQQRCHHGWSQAEKFSKFVLSGTLKILKWFLKNSYVHMKNLYGYKLVRAVKRSELKRCNK